jgi:N,N'-diacetyllegionaminate synthase
VNVLCLVPARGGSKRLPRKNLAEVGGASLTGRAVMAARRFGLLAGLPVRVVVDTDDVEIAREGRAWGAEVPFLREASLAADDTTSAASTLAAIDRLTSAGWTADAVILLQPTSPLRSAEDILACWRTFDASARPSVTSVTATDHPAELVFRQDGAGKLAWAWPAAREPWIGTRFPAGVQLTGSVYVVTPAFLRARSAFVLAGETVGVACPRERSVDVDTAADLHIADAIARAGETRPIDVGGRLVGEGHPCFVIAEAGVNHNGDASLAHRLVDVAADAGADAVKFQTFDPALLAAASAPRAAYQVERTGGEASQQEMLRQLVLGRDDTAAVARHARDRGILFLSTPFDDRSADFLADLGVPMFKIASGEVTNGPFLKHVASKGRPVILSTGMSTIAEAAAAVELLEASGANGLAVLHCVSEYPAKVASSNLRAMATLRSVLGLPTGLSDHTLGLTASLAAVAMGASIIEKHFTLDRTMPGPDHTASLEPDELKTLMAEVRAIESARGDGRKVPTAGEMAVAAVARRSLHATRDLPAGHRLAPGDLIALRPGTGLSPMLLDAIVGRTLTRAREAGSMLHAADLG